MRNAAEQEQSGSALREFLESEAAGGLLLIFASALGLLVANSPFAADYFLTLHAPVGPISLELWINDALMAVFFLLVGLEIKREFVEGHLATWADRRLPVVAALGGMIVPALVYLFMTRYSPALARGWAIPAATDIAFAIGVLALLGRRIPASLKLFLTTVAIVDDMGAVAIIAFAYTAGLNLAALAAAGVILGAMLLLNRAGVMALRYYLALAVLLWLAVFSSGVHATIAGVLTALAIPVRTRDGQIPPLLRLEHMLQRPVAWLIVPMFGFANAGVALGGYGGTSTLPVAIIAGLFVGKQVGIFGSVWGSVATGLAKRPMHASWPQIYGVSLLCGIGFTMSLFIGGLAFGDPALQDGVKIGVLAGSMVAALAGYGVLRLAAPRDSA